MKMFDRLRSLGRSASRLAISIAGSGLKRETKIHVSRRVAKGVPYGHYIAYQRIPPTLLYGERHAFLHATKGWRSYARLPHALIDASRRQRKAA